MSTTINPMMTPGMPMMAPAPMMMAAPPMMAPPRMPGMMPQAQPAPIVINV